MSHTLIPIALLMLISSGCSMTPVAPPAQPVVPRISEQLRQPCEPLPPLTVDPGTQDMRPALLANRAEADRVHQDCTLKHQGVIEAVGAMPAARRDALRERREDRRQARATRSETTTTED